MIKFEGTPCRHFRTPRFPKLTVSLFSCLLLVSSVSSDDFFSSCRFHFGALSANSTLMPEIDYLVAWAGSGENFNMQSFFTTCKSNGKTPVIIAYIIAFTARADWGLQDCNVGTPNLCQQGANYIRDSTARILRQYAKYAVGAEQSFGSANPMIWCMEPDYSQYSESSQTGGGLSVAQAGALMNQILDTILSHAPNSVFSMDISPWKDTTFQKSWFAAMNLTTRFKFVNTSGGQSTANSTFISNTCTTCPKWAWVFKTFGTPLIADADYGTAGGSTGYDTRWNDVANLTARIQDGVVAVSHYNPTASYPTDITTLRSQIPTPPKCPTANVAIISAGKSDVSLFNPASVSNGLLEIIDLSGRILCSKKFVHDAVAWDKWRGDGTLLHSGVSIIRLHGINQSLQKKVFITN